MAFGISPDTLALRPSTLIQDRAGRESRAQQASQYQRSRQDAKDRFAESLVSQEASRQDARDRFAESMASQEATRKADFAKTEYLSEQKLLIEKSKLDQKVLDDKSKADKDTRSWAEKSAESAIRAGRATYDQWNELVDYFVGVKTGQTGQPPIQQPQPTGTGNEEAELRAEMERIQQGGQPVQQEWKGIPYPMPEQAEEVAQQPQQPQHEYTDAYKAMNPYIISSIKQAEEPVDVTPAPVIPQAKAIPQSVAGTDYEPDYVAIKDKLKSSIRPKKADYTTMGTLGKRKIVDTKAYNSDMKTWRKEKYAGEKELRGIVFDAKKAKKEEQKALKPTYAKSQDIKAVKANLKRDKSINKWGEARTIASLDEALDYIISKNLSPELFKDELSKWSTQEKWWLNK